MPKQKTDRDGLYKVSNSPYWRGSFTNASGQRIRRSTGKAEKAAAKVVLAEWIAREGAPKPGQTKLHAFDELMLAYLEEGRTIKGREKSAKTRARDEGCAAALYDAFTEWWLLPIGLESTDIQGDVIDGRAIHWYAEQRRANGVTDSGIRRELSILGSAITYANAWWSWGLVDPTRHRKPTQGEGRIRWISREESDRLIAVARDEPRAPHLADWIQAALHTGCRKDELLGLTWDRVDLRAGTLYLEAVHTKSKRRQSVPLNQQAREALLSRARFRAAHCPQSPWVFATKAGERILDIKKGFTTACRKAGIENFRPHDCRHTLASWLVMEGVPLRTVKEILRHSSITVTEQYAHLEPMVARAGVEVLDVTPTSHLERKQKFSVVSG